jgi:hypothetical protein
MAECMAFSYDRPSDTIRSLGLERGSAPTRNHPTTPPPAPENDPMAAIGRLGQFLGLSIPAVAVLLELNHAISLGQMLVMLVAALCCFWIGRILEGYARS